MNINPRDALTLLTLLIGMFGNKKKKRLALELFPLVSDALDQWPMAEVRLREVAAEDPVLSRFRETLDRIYRSAKAV